MAKYETCDCGEKVYPEDPYFATPCGTHCSDCMQMHARECGICASEFDIVPPKVLTDKDILAVITKAMTTSELLDDAATYKRFVEDAAELVSSYFGGFPHEAENKDGVWSVTFEHDSEGLLASAYAEVDTVVDWSKFD